MIHFHLSKYIYLILSLQLLHFSITNSWVTSYNNDNNVNKHIDNTNTNSKSINSYKKHYVPMENHIDNSTCTAEFGVVGKEKCLVAVIDIYQYSKEVLFQVLLDEDLNNFVRRINIKIHDGLESIRVEQNNSELNNHVIIGEHVDEFILARPWWVIIRETYHGHMNFQHPSHVVFLRQGQLYEPRLRLHAGIRFPPADVCKQTPFNIGHFVNYGMGTLQIIYAMEFGRHMFQLFEVYDTNSNEPNEGVNYVSMTDCPGLVNRRLCIFMPLTNCPLPDELVNAKGDSFQSQFPGNSIFRFDSVNGEWIRVKDDVDENKKNDYQLQLLKQYKEFPPLYPAEIFYHGEKVRTDYTYMPNVEERLPADAMLLRLNAKSRYLVQRRIHDMKITQLPEDVHSGSKLQCTSIHIRRGDRIINGVDMHEYCASVWRPSKKEQSICINKNTNQTMDCHHLLDIGCFHEKSYGELSLQNYLDRAYQIHKSKNIFVLTDDGKWLEEEKKKIDVNWNVFYIHAKENSRFHEHPSATENGIDIFASVAMARECQAFVGHWGSAVSHMIYNYMCFSHSDIADRCPPAVNMGGDLAW